MIRKLGMVLIFLGLVAIVFGGIFLGEGIIKNNLIVNRMKVEQVALALDPNNPNDLTPITNASSAQAAADLIASHRRAIAPTYQALGKFDPTNTTDLKYAQAMNLENYLYLAVVGFGLVQVALASGAFMVITGIAIGITGYVVWRPGKTV
jgi:hypothetical protein